LRCCGHWQGAIVVWYKICKNGVWASDTSPYMPLEAKAVQLTKTRPLKGQNCALVCVMVSTSRL
jgi:hypothetical protein